MKIIHIISGLNGGGAENVLLRLTCLDDVNDHHVISLTTEGVLGPKFRANGIKLTCLNMKRGKLSIAGVVKLWRLLKVETSDCVQTWMYHSDLIGGVIARLTGHKVLWGIRHSNFKISNSNLQTVIIMLFNSLLSHLIPLKIICCAESARLTHQRVGYSRTKMVVIENGVDCKIFDVDHKKRGFLRKRYLLADKTFVIGMVARFTEQKDHKNLLLGFKKFVKTIPDTVCVLAGKGMDSSNHALIEMIVNLNLSEKIILLGEVDGSAELMQAVDLNVLSSSFGEGYPNVLIEAMACGTPSIATNVGDSKSILGESGWIIDPQNSSELGDALINAYELFLKSNKWQKLCVKCRSTAVSQNNIETTLKKYLNIWAS